jgi:uncharacterized protein DUF1348
METKPPPPPFTSETAAQKARMAEDAWNTRDPDRVVLVYTEDRRWRVHQPADQAHTHSGEQRWCRREQSCLRNDSCDVETNAPIPWHGPLVASTDAKVSWIPSSNSFASTLQV